MSRRAVSCEHFASLAHSDVVSFPSNPSSRRLSDPVNVPVHGLETTNVDTLEDRLLRELEAETFHAAQQVSLIVVDSGQSLSPAVAVSRKPGPVRQVVNVKA